MSNERNSVIYDAIIRGAKSLYEKRPKDRISKINQRLSQIYSILLKNIGTINQNKKRVFSKTTIIQLSILSIIVCLFITSLCFYLSIKNKLDCLKNECDETYNRISLVKIINGSIGVNGLIYIGKDYLVSGGWDEKVYFWNIASGKLIKTLCCNKGGVLSLAYKENNYLAIGSSKSSDGKICLFDHKEEKLIKILLNDYNGDVLALVYIDKDKLVSGSNDGTIRIWNVQTEDCDRIKAHRGAVLALAYTGNGYLASGSEDYRIKIWNVNDGELIKTFKEHTNSVTSLIFLKNGNLVSGSLDNTIKIWNLNEYYSIKTLEGKSSVRTLAYNHNNYLVLGSGDGTINIWDVNKGKPSMAFRVHESAVNALTFINESYLATGSWNEYSMKIFQINS